MGRGEAGSAFYSIPSSTTWFWKLCMCNALLEIKIRLTVNCCSSENILRNFEVRIPYQTMMGEIKGNGCWRVWMKRWCCIFCWWFTEVWVMCQPCLIGYPSPVLRHHLQVPPGSSPHTGGAQNIFKMLSYAPVMFNLMEPSTSPSHFAQPLITIVPSLAGLLTSPTGLIIVSTN